MITIIVLILILNIGIMVSLYNTNKDLKNELKELENWCDKELENIIIRENEFDVLLDGIIVDMETERDQDIEEKSNTDKDLTIPNRIYAKIIHYKKQLLDHIKCINEIKNKLK